MTGAVTGVVTGSVTAVIGQPASGSDRVLQAVMAWPSHTASARLGPSRSRLGYFLVRTSPLPGHCPWPCLATAQRHQPHCDRVRLRLGPDFDGRGLVPVQVDLSTSLGGWEPGPGAPIRPPGRWAAISVLEPPPARSNFVHWSNFAASRYSSAEIVELDGGVGTVAAGLGPWVGSRWDLSGWDLMWRSEITTSGDVRSQISVISCSLLP